MLFYKDPATYFAVGERGLILNTSNYGANWSFPSNTRQNSLNGICFPNTLTGWAVGADSTVLKTEDGGLSWEQNATGFASEYQEVQFKDVNNGWILGTKYGSQTNQVFLATNDGGETWENTFKSFEEIVSFKDVFFIDSLNGWLISTSKIYATVDGGKKWKQQYTTNNTGWGGEYLNAITFVDKLNGFCVGEKSNKALLLKTSDGGTTWTPQQLTFDAINDIHFISNLVGWLVGENGLILRTQNGCQTFEYLISNTTYDLYDVYFIDDNYGWAITNMQTILSTKDGGITWKSSTFSSSYSDDGLSVFFTDTLNGYIGSRDGMFKTTNGGVDWTELTLPNYSHDYITDIYFFNKNIGWALMNSSSWSSGGAIYYTSDGGTTWNVKLNSGERFNAMSFIPGGDGWAVGNNSVIANYSGGPVSVSLSKTIIGPTKFQLYQCYPNPFNPSTTITYDLPKNSHVDIKVYDSLGREIKTLINESKEMGRHQIVLDMHNFASGTYFYRMIADDFVKTKKLLYVK